MIEVTYRLELCPTEAGREYYKNKVFESNENAGVDLYVVDDYDWKSLTTNVKPTLLNLGCSARLVRIDSNGFEQEVHYWLCPRSSIIKTGLMMANSQGVIDRSYRGELKAPVWVVSPLSYSSYFSTNTFKGNRFFQIVAPDMGFIREVRVVDSLNETLRGSGGFGSTGTR